MRKFIPTPSSSTLELGFFTVHFYALAILLGIVFAIWLTKSRYSAMGGDPSEISDLSFFVVPAGIIGGRVYHVITSPQKYFGDDGSPLQALQIWRGGLGIWGAISFGGLAAYVFFRVKKRSLDFAQLADAIAPGLLLAQGIGRFGNWFNAELFGKPTSLPWGLEIPSANRPTGFEAFETFHPTFLYEAIWCFGIAGLILTSSSFKNFTRAGTVFAFYVMAYSFGRFFIEAIRIDEANLILGIRLNLWVSSSFFIGGLAVFLRGRSINNRRFKAKGYG
jgi:prolipoprotein diacylglyceryl transferase